jgi:uncharacterized repeat protein (TIGR03803 family)
MAGRTLYLSTVACALSLIGIRPAAAGTFESLYQFTGGADGGNPLDGAVSGPNHSLFGTASIGGSAPQPGGTVFQLAPPVAGSTIWTLSTLYSFTGGSDGSQPVGGVVLDSSGHLYGTNQNTNAVAGGVAFELAPPTTPGQPWPMTVLHSFTGPDGQSAAASMIFDKTTTLYGTSEGGAHDDGNIFALQPPTKAGSPWKARTLYSFSDAADGGFPQCRLVHGPTGALFGTTPVGGAGPYNGTVFRLAPAKPAGIKWKFLVLYSFPGGIHGSQPYPGLVFDTNGAAYGVTWSGGANNFGVIFRLAPSGSGPWTETVLYSFAGHAESRPFSALLRDRAGNLFGTTTGIEQSNETGELFELSPPGQQGGAWTFQPLHVFSGTDGGYPGGDLLFGPKGAIIGTTKYGGASDMGTVYRYTP